MDNDELRRTWCRMWSEDPSLAHDLMSATCTQWSGQTDALDRVVGPDQQVDFVTAYRALHVNVFRPRLLVDGGERFAYLWDVTRPDGTVSTGLDVNQVSEGRITENWTFVNPARLEAPAGDAPVDGALGAADLATVADRWVELLNGRYDLAQELWADDVEWFAGDGPGSADGRRGRTDLLEHLRRQVVPSTSTAIHREPVVDVAHQRLAVLRSTSTNAGEGAAVDLLAVHRGRISSIWSLSAGRPFRN